MKIHEYQAKGILARMGIAVPRGVVVVDSAAARLAAEEIGGKVVLKAQVHAGGRGKAGGVKIVSSPDEAEETARAMLGKRLVTHQTGLNGAPVDRVLLEETVNVIKELYLAITIDRALAMPVMMASEAGGMDIEEIAAKSPERILKEHIDPLIGFQPFQGRRLSFGLGLSGEQLRQAQAIMSRLYDVFKNNDCSLAEINPLVVTGEGKVIALDAKLNIDDNALFRHSDLAEMYDPGQEDPLEAEANKHRINYVKLDGSIGCLVNGAGLAMASMDIIKQMGEAPANFLDIGGGANAERVASALRLLVSDPDVRVVLINMFGGITRLDSVAEGIVEAVRMVKVELPIVVRLAGTNMEAAWRILEDSGLGFILVTGLREAAVRAVEEVRKK